MVSERTEAPVLKLKVTEALSKDVGRGIARLGPEDLDRLQVAIGDPVEVTGKRGTVCKVMPAHKELRGQSRIQIDGLVRENAGVGLDEFVQVRKTTCRPAERVVLASAGARPSERDLDYIGSLLDACRYRRETASAPRCSAAGGRTSGWRAPRPKARS